jgi:hypothetical protein
LNGNPFDEDRREEIAAKFPLFMLIFCSPFAVDL